MNKSKVLEIEGLGRMNLSSSQQPQTADAFTGKHLYLCTVQFDRSGFNRFVMHRIKLSDLLSQSESKVRSLPLHQVTNETGDFPLRAGCGVFGSKIIFGGGLEFDGTPSKQMFSVETDTADHKLMPFPSLPGGKDFPLLLEMQEQLYVLNSDISNWMGNETDFEVFNESCYGWDPLPPAPIWDPESPYYNSPVGIASVVTDTSILVSRQASPVFRFDVTNPVAGWSEQKSLCSGRSFPFHGTTLVQNCAHGGFVIFAMDIDYGYVEKPSTRFPRIPVYLMSKDYDGLTFVKTVELPFTHALPDMFCMPVKYRFLDLGAQRVGLVLAVFNKTDDGEGMNFLVTTFQYKVSDSGSFSYEYPSHPVTLEYNMRQHTLSPATIIALMQGAFVLAARSSRINVAKSA